MEEIDSRVPTQAQRLAYVAMWKIGRINTEELHRLCKGISEEAQKRMMKRSGKPHST